MLANIRVHENGQSRFLCELDLMKFTKEQVQERMNERGLDEESFFVCGFSDWGVDTIFTLGKAYLLKKIIVELYEEDEFVVCYLLKQGKSLVEIATRTYHFVTKDEEELMVKLLEQAEFSSVIHFFRKAGDWVTAIQSYIEKGVVLNTPKGFYVDEDYFH